MVPCTHPVVFVINGWRGKPLITMELLLLFSSNHLVVTGELTHTVVPYAHTVVVCVLKGGGADKHGALKVVFQWFFEEDLPTQCFCVATKWLFVL